MFRILEMESKWYNSISSRQKTTQHMVCLIITKILKIIIILLDFAALTCVASWGFDVATIAMVIARLHNEIT